MDRELRRNPFKGVALRPKVRTIVWSIANVQTDAGRPYDHDAFPHLGAPGGPMDALDCPQVSTIVFQAGSRTGKTFFGLTAALKYAATDPCPMMFVSADQKLAIEVIGRQYRMIEKCPPLKDGMLPEHRRRQDLVVFPESREYVGWARSTSTLADKPVKFGHANEVDKWEHKGVASDKATEADPLKLWTDRFKEFPVFKRIIESTPTVKNKSRIEHARLGSTNCNYYVPCPHCGKYQRLVMDRLKWNKTEAGKQDKEIARKTARYVCVKCERDIRDEHRGEMMRSGVWCPEGCEVDDDIAAEIVKGYETDDVEPWAGWNESPWIKGVPLRDGQDAGFQISSLYAGSLTWGRIAAEFVESVLKPQLLRNFINQWLGETWELASRKETWEKIGERIIDHGCQRGTVPSWASLLTAAVDRQGRDGGKFPWIVLAWGPGFRCHVVSYGECDTFAEVEAVLKTPWNHADGGNPLRVAYTLFDSGYRPDGVYEFCVRMIGQGLQCWPAKGSNTAMNSDFTRSTLSGNTSMPGMELVMVDTVRSQLWIENRIFEKEGRNTTVFGGSLGEHEDFLQQILNDAPVEQLDSKNNARESWQRINESLPNDYRDTWRYAWVAMLIFQGGSEPMPRRLSLTKTEPIAQQPSRIREMRIRR